MFVSPSVQIRLIWRGASQGYPLIAAMRVALADATDAELDIPQADVTPADTIAGRS
jgi:hypothetical protein